MTTEPLTPAEIPALRALADKATPGPWRQHLVDDTTVVDRFGEEIAQTFPEGGNNDDVDFATNTEQREDDAAFIAAARDALPRALDTIEAQAKTIAERDAEIERLREIAEERVSDIGPQELSGPGVGAWASAVSDAVDNYKATCLTVAQAEIARLTRERDEARAALASARAEALEEAATAATRAAWKHEGADDYSRGMDRGAREQVEACAAAIRALKEARR